MISWNAGVCDQCLKVTTLGKMIASPGNGPVVPAEAPSGSEICSWVLLRSSLLSGPSVHPGYLWMKWLLIRNLECPFSQPRCVPFVPQHGLFKNMSWPPSAVEPPIEMAHCHHVIFRNSRCVSPCMSDTPWPSLSKLFVYLIKNKLKMKSSVILRLLLAFLS